MLLEELEEILVVDYGEPFPDANNYIILVHNFVKIVSTFVFLTFVFFISIYFASLKLASF
jgi:hypothetical protein